MMTGLSEQRLVVVVGASGFVGSAVLQALGDSGVTAVPLAAPRLTPRPPDRAHEHSEGDRAALESLRTAIQGAGAVVNCAGIADASSVDELALTAANATLPFLIGKAAHAEGCFRFVHVSSAVVQGRQPLLDETKHYDAFSSYARSKVAGETGALLFPRTTCYRPPSVHSSDRRITRALTAIARSPLRSVAAPGVDPSPQALLGNVASAVTFLTTCGIAPPEIVIHPWEGLTTSDLMALLGNREPHVLPRPLARGVVEMARRTGSVVPRIEAHARRLEMMWFGQEQAPSWLEQAGWKPPLGREQWRKLTQSRARLDS